MSATIVSFMPFDIVEHKPGLVPGGFTIWKAIGEKFGITNIVDGIYYRVNPDPLAEEGHTHFINVPVRAIELAQSLIFDYVNATLGVQLPDAMPGLVSFPGELDRKEIVIRHQDALKTTKSQQAAWCRNLVDMADDIWAKTRSPLTISDTQRHAAEWLELKRDWLYPVLPENIEKCPVCKNPINAGALKCSTPGCGFVLDPVEYNKLLQVTGIASK